MANTLAYYDTGTITAVKSFIVQAPGANVIKLFMAVITPLVAYFSMILTELRRWHCNYGANVIKLFTAVRYDFS